MLKRSVDFTLAGLLLVIALPLLAVAAIIVKWDSEGEVIFRQVRMGRRFRSFHLLKLRTMRASLDGPAYTLGADPRITRAGRWLRRFKLDELPQLWNVLCGDMSLVGPRPVIPELTEEFKRAYARLLEVRPGLTDPATVKYCREEEILALVAEPMDYFKRVVTPDKLRISQEYIERASLLSDLGVMLQTVLALFRPARQPRFIQLVPLRAQTGPLRFDFAGPVRGRRDTAGAERTAITGPIELMGSVEEINDRCGPVPANRLDFRH
jgi:lipopolysaccharide/colanic/teichoic acid biosynthesis glycosyltransferase